MTDPHLLAAVRNNALWCDLICCAHGQTTQFSNDLWRTLQAPPRFYPSAVTLTETISPQPLNTLPHLGAIKDSFASLDLAPLGYTPLFDATWLYRAPSPIEAPVSVQWGIIQTPNQLTQWEAAWAGYPASPEPTLFPPNLLTVSNLIFLIAYAQQEIVAGAIAYQTDSVVGVSNLFTPEHDPAPYWAGCLAAVQSHIPNLPIVDYEHGPSLDTALSLGFEPLGPLRVWLPPA